MLQVHETVGDAYKAFNWKLREVMGSGEPWMACVFRPVDGAVECFSTRHKFPPELVGSAVAALLSRFSIKEKETGLLPDAPLPLADMFRRPFTQVGRPADEPKPEGPPDGNSKQGAPT